MSSANMTILINVVVQILAIIVVFLILHKLTWIPFINYLNERKRSVALEFNQSMQTKEKYEHLKKQLEDDLININKKRAKILNEAKELSDDIIKQSKQKADIQISKKQKEADDIIDKKYKVAQEEINKQAKKTAIFLLKNMLENKETNFNQSEKFLKDLKGIDNENAR